MSTQPEFQSFQCKNSGCTETLTPQNVRTISLHVSCLNLSPAMACPRCGRLHWLNGEAVRNRQYDNAFLTAQGDLENRPMLSSEKVTFIRETIVPSDPNADITNIDEVHDILTTLIIKGHAPDCPAKEDKGKCTCFHDVAETWIAWENKYFPKATTV